MKRALGMAASLLGFALVAGPVSAQVTLGVGASATVPVSDYGDYADTGWGIAGTIGRALNPNTSLVGVVSYGSNNHSDVDGDKTNLIGVGGNLVYFFSEGAASPFVVGGLGALGHQYKSDTFPEAEGTDWQAFANGGAGLAFPLGSARGYLLANYVHGFDDTTYLGLGGGIAVPVGG